MCNWIVRSIVNGKYVVLDSRGYISHWTDKQGAARFTEAGAKYLAIMLESPLISGLQQRHKFVAEEI